MLTIGKTYKTKFATEEKFTITDIQKKEIKDTESGQMVEKIVQIKGFYSKNPGLTDCVINEDRLIDDEQEIVSLQKPEISIEDFSKLDIRICEILEIIKVPKKDRLYQLKINTGFDERTVVSSIAHLFTIEDLLGKKVPFVLNLKPRAIAGIESTAMIILASSVDETKHYLIENQNCETGSILI